MRRKKSRKVTMAERLFLYLLVCYIALVFGTAYQLAGCSVGTLIVTLDITRLPWYPNQLKYNMLSLKAVGIGSLVYILALLMYISRDTNFMPDREFGSSKWADVRSLDKELADGREGYNRILSQNLKLSLDGDKTNLNSHVLVIGGSGAGKSFYFTASNFLSNPYGSFIVTDPKGELLRNLGGFLKRMGNRIQVLNFLDPAHSDHFNPFHFLRTDQDVNELVENIMKNTTEKENTSQDPFWDKAEGLLYRCLFNYIRLEKPPELRTFRTFLDMLMEVKPEDPKKPSKLHLMMEALALKSDLGTRHPAYRCYQKFMSGATDTFKSILMCSHSRLDFLDNETILSLMDDNTIDIAGMGNGANGDRNKKTFTFCVIPDNKKIYNPIVGMFYTQCFNELYFQADVVHDGKLPLPVTFWFDEFANVALPTDFISELTTMRSRNMSSVIIIQNLAQIKKLFGQDLWETIPGNCDTMVYLGGNEPSTHKYVVELLGKMTIHKKSHGESKGQHGSSSENVDGLGRELLDVSELRKLSRKDSIVLISGKDPVIDAKPRTWQNKWFSLTGWSGHKYIHKPDKPGEFKEDDDSGMLSAERVAFYKKEQERGRANFINLTVEEILMLNEVDFGASLEPPVMEQVLKPSSTDEETEIILDEESGETTEDNGDSLTKRMAALNFTPDQLVECKAALGQHMPEKDILLWFLPDIPAKEMKKMRCGNS